MATKIEILLEAQNRVSRELRRIRSDVNNLDTALKANTANAAANAAATQRLTQGFRSASAAGSGLRNVLLGFGGIALFAGVVRTVAQFEQALQNVQAVTGATGVAFEALREEARRLGATTIFSATQAAEGLEFLGRAGFTTVESISALEGTLNLAAAGALGLGEAADISSNVISAFNLNATEAGRVANVLAEAAASSNTNVQQLGEAIRFVGPVAASFGVSLEQATGALGTLGNAGIQASSAGTGLRRILSALGTQTPKLTALLRRLGVSFSDVNPATNDLTDIIDRLSNSSLTAADALEVFGDRGAPAILALASQSETLQNLNQELLESSRGIGTAAEISAVQTNSLIGAFRQLQSAVEETVLQIGDGGLLGGLRELVDTLSGVVRTLNGTQDPLADNAVLYRQIADAVESLRLVIVALVATRVAGFLGNVGTGLLSLGTSVRVATVGLTGLTRAAVAARTVFLTALGPLGWIVGIGLALADFANNDAQATIDQLREVENRIQGIRTEAQGLSADQLRRNAAAAQIEVGQLRSQLDGIQDDIANERSNISQQEASNAGLRSFDRQLIDQANLEQLQAEEQGIQQRLDALQKEADERDNLFAAQRDQEQSELNRQIQELTQIEADATTAELDAERAKQALLRAENEQRLQSAKDLADEEFKAGQAALDADLAQRNISLEDYYAGLRRLAVASADAEIAILGDKIEQQNILNQQQIDDLTAQGATAVDQAASPAQADALQREFSARLVTLQSNLEAEGLANEAAILELGRRREAIIAANNAKEIQAIQDRNDRIRTDEEKASNEALKDLQDRLDDEAQAVTAAADRRRAILQRQRDSGELTGFAADTEETQINTDEAGELDVIAERFERINGVLGDKQIQTNIDEIRERITLLGSQVPQDLAQINDSIDNNLISAFESVIEGTKSVEDAFKQLVLNIAKELLNQQLTNAISGVGSAITSAFSPGTGGGAGGGNSTAQTAGFIASLFAAGGGLVKAASGGYITGPGTATSDSIPARLSDGEYVMNAGAVKHYGVNFMEAVNRMAMQSGGTARKFAITRPRRMNFNEGGLVTNTGSGSDGGVPQRSLRIVNVVDTNMVNDFLSGPEGEDLIVNAIRRNGSSVKQLLR